MRLQARRRQRKTIAMPEITLTPLIDTALTLLIIFMVTTPMIHNAIKVDLPRGRIKEDTGATQELVVYIDKKEAIYINGTPVAAKNFVAQLQRAVGRQEDMMVYVKADRLASHGFVTETIDQMKRVEGISHVALAT